MKAAQRRQQSLSSEQPDDVELKLLEAAERIGGQVFENIKTDPQKSRYDEAGSYLKPFERFGTLKNQEDYAYLFNLYANGTEKEKLRARDLIVYGNAKLVVSISLRWTGRGLDLPDLMQEGFIGLFRGVKLYDITKGFRFSTYASLWIKQAITRAIYDLGEKRPYRVPVHAEESLSLVRRTCTELYINIGRWPKELQVYEKIKASETKAAQRLKLVDIVHFMRMIAEGQVIRLDAPRVFDGENRDETIGDSLFVGPPRTETIVEARRLSAEYEKAIRRIEAAVDQLSPRSAMVVRLRYGLGEFEAMTLEEVGQRYEVTREWIRQIEQKALEEIEAKLGITPAEIAEIVDVAQELEVLAHAI